VVQTLLEHTVGFLMMLLLLFLPRLEYAAVTSLSEKVPKNVDGRRCVEFNDDPAPAGP
jgi:hypothetical protein